MTFPEIEISVKYKNKVKIPELRKIKCSADAYKIALEIFNADQIEWTEEFIMLCMQANGKITGYYRVSRGGMNYTVADVRVCATVALNCLATRVIIMHNHPSGGLTPSEGDKSVTRKFNEAFKLLDIRLEDHLIVTTEGYYSFGDEGYL